MTGQAPGRLAWQQATVTAGFAESETARTIVLDVPAWGTHRAGQHVDVRLTAPDGYQATRSYSISSAPDEPPQITVERVGDGEVSPFLVDVVEVGDTFEVRGPIGGYFVWEPEATPLLLIGGGSGIAPLRAMWRVAPDASQVTVLYSARDRTHLIYHDELARRDRVSIHLTRETAPGFGEGRLDTNSFVTALDGDTQPQTFVCGPTAFVEVIIAELSRLVDDRRTIRAERFG
jgi:ferredoxin-NADP reductase